jgi:hypothetical protein
MRSMSNEHIRRVQRQDKVVMLHDERPSRRHAGFPLSQGVEAWPANWVCPADNSHRFSVFSSQINPVSAVIVTQFEPPARRSGYGSNAIRFETPPGTLPDNVIILAALNCPSSAAQRADTMAKRLTELGIPNTRANNYSASITDRDQLPLLERTSVVMHGEIPIVIVNGMAKANPTVDEVASEFRRGK